MKVQKGSNLDIPHVMHVDGNIRQYSVRILNYPKEIITFSYPNTPVKEYIFDSGFAISGSDTHGLFGVVVNGKYYFEEFSKFAKVFTNNSPFWERKKFGDTFELNLNNKNKVEFSADVNLWFSIGEYWHWFCEDIPLIQQLRSNDFPIVTNKLSKWQKDSLSFFPDILERLVEVDTPCIVYAKRFHTFTFPAQSYRGKTSEWVPKFLNDSFKATEKLNPTSLVYISRGDAVARCVENEEDVKYFLKSKGFTCYDNFSEMSIQEKINVFNGAKLVVAPTGSNLTHCHAMQPDTCVLDFNHDFEIEEECGWNSIGTGVGVKWFTIPAFTGSIGPRSKNGKKAKNNNLIVDIDGLEAALKYVMG